MTSSATLPLCSKPAAFEFLSRQLRSLDSTDALLNGSIAIAMHAMDTVNPERIDRQVQKLADAVRRRARGDNTRSMLVHLHEVLFEQHLFTGNAEDYYNPANSFVPTVLRTRRGLPITLSLIYRVVAERLGIRAWGIGLPGHFMVGVRDGQQRLLVDPFNDGQLVSPDECRERLTEMLGPDVEWSDDLLKPISHRHWLTRILQNLLNIYGSAGRYSDVAAVLEMEMLLWPNQDHLQRDLALVLARCGLSRPASIWLDRYLQNNPDDPQHNELSQLLEVLK